MDAIFSSSKIIVVFIVSKWCYVTVIPQLPTSGFTDLPTLTHFAGDSCIYTHSHALPLAMSILTHIRICIINLNNPTSYNQRCTCAEHEDGRSKWWLFTDRACTRLGRARRSPKSCIIIYLTQSKWVWLQVLQLCRQRRGNTHIMIPSALNWVGSVFH